MCVCTKKVEPSQKVSLSLPSVSIAMWVVPKTTLGGAGMWEDIRSNDVIHLQRYKLEGTAMEGAFRLLAHIMRFLRPFLSFCLQTES